MFKSRYADWCGYYCGPQTLSKEDELKMLDLEEKALEQRLELVRKAKKSTAEQKEENDEA